MSSFYRGTSKLGIVIVTAKKSSNSNYIHMYKLTKMYCNVSHLLNKFLLEVRKGNVYKKIVKLFKETQGINRDSFHREKFKVASLIAFFLFVGYNLNCLIHSFSFIFSFKKIHSFIFLFLLILTSLAFNPFWWFVQLPRRKLILVENMI